VRHLTGTQARLEPNAVERWLTTRQHHHDRADWAVVRRCDGAFLGEAVLNELDAPNASVNYRVWLAGPEATGRGHGTEVTRLVISYALNDVGHRVALGVYAFNPRARRVYEKCGFQVEGRRRDTLRRDGSWHDEIMMSVLSTASDQGIAADAVGQESPATGVFRWSQFGTCRTVLPDPSRD